MRNIKVPANGIVTEEFLRDNPDYIFVFGDNVIRKGTAGAAKLRYHPQSYGFITKKIPDTRDTSYYIPEEYLEIYRQEMLTLKIHIRTQPNKIFIISKLGAGLVNKFGIYEKVIKPNLVNDLKEFSNIIILE